MNTFPVIVYYRVVDFRRGSETGSLWKLLSSSENV